MLIWGHLFGIMELFLNNYLEHFLIIEKLVFLFTESAIKLLLHANVQNSLAYRIQPIELAATWMFLWTREPVTTTNSGPPKLSIRNIHQSYGQTHIHAGSDKSWSSWKNLSVPKGLQMIAQLWIVN